MSTKQTSLFPNSKLQQQNPKQLTESQKAYLWLEHHKYAGYDGKYHILSYKQLIKLLHWNILHGSQISNKKQKMLMMLPRLKSTRYYHIHSLLKYNSYDGRILVKIKDNLKKQLQDKNNR